jgi:2-keto-4-pentenoate hydratase
VKGDGLGSASKDRESVAAALVSSRRSGQLLDPLPESVRPQSIAEGYLVQRLAHPMLEEQGFGRQGGWKIGCTTKVMQEYLKIDEPIAGAMFLSSMWHGNHRFPVALPRILGVECEIAVRLHRDLPSLDQTYSIEDVADAVAAVMASIEVVENRYVEYQTLDSPTLVADDFFNFGCVLGPEIESFDPRDLKEVTAGMDINGVRIGSGRGVDILGDPLLVLAWLANHCVEFETPLRAGDVVTLGSLVQTQWVSPGDSVEVHNDMLGDVTATFVAAERQGS